MKKRIKRPALSGTQIGIMLIGSLCLLLFGMLLAIQNYLEHQISEEQEQTVYFDRHYAMLLEENEDPFWTAVYDSAEQMGKEKNACVELIGEGMPSSFGLAGKLSVVIDSQVDGIIIRPDASDEVNELIEQAKKILNRQKALYLVKELLTVANSDEDLDDKEIDFVIKVSKALQIEDEKVAEINQLVLDYMSWNDRYKQALEID